MNNADASSLLRSLGAGIRPDAAKPARSSAPVESKDFASLLADAAKQPLNSLRPIEFEPGTNPGLTEYETNQLARLIDAAELGGATRLAVVHEEQLLHVDVLTRTVDKLGPFDPNNVATDIDSIARLESDPSITEENPRTRAFANAAANLLGVRNESLANILGAIADATDPDEANTRPNRSGAA